MRRCVLGLTEKACNAYYFCCYCYLLCCFCCPTTVVMIAKSLLSITLSSLLQLLGLLSFMLLFFFLSSVCRLQCSCFFEYNTLALMLLLFYRALGVLTWLSMYVITRACLEQLHTDNMLHSAVVKYTTDHQVDVVTQGRVIQVNIPLGSTVTKALLYADVHGSDGYLGGLELTFLNSITGAEQTWDAKGSDCGQAFSPIVGSGMLVGAQCWAAEAIDALGLIFLREITWGSQVLTLGKVPCSSKFFDIVEPGKVRCFASSKTCKSAPPKHTGCPCKLIHVSICMCNITASWAKRT